MLINDQCLIHGLAHSPPAVCSMSGVGMEINDHRSSLDATHHESASLLVSYRFLGAQPAASISLEVVGLAS